MSKSSGVRNTVLERIEVRFRNQNHGCRIGRAGVCRFAHVRSRARSARPGKTEARCAVRRSFAGSINHRPQLPEQFAHLPPLLNCSIGIAPMRRLPSCVAAVHAAPLISHCRRSTRLPGSPGIGSTSWCGMGALHGITHFCGLPPR